MDFLKSMVGITTTRPLEDDAAYEEVNSGMSKNSVSKNSVGSTSKNSMESTMSKNLSMGSTMTRSNKPLSAPLMATSNKPLMGGYRRRSRSKKSKKSKSKKSRSKKSRRH